jgi:2-dehydropantoate 2-reductase
MRILVFGTGGVGGYFGGRLAQADLDVSFIARGKHLQALNEHGLLVQSIYGDFKVKPIQVTENPSMIGEVDAVILGVKSWQVQEAAIALRPVIGPNTFVIPLQNGVEAPSHLSEILGAKHVVGGMCRIISYIGEPGRICHVGMNPFITFGELNKKPSDRIQRLYSLFSQTKGLTAEIASDILASMWEKFVLIAPWSGIGAITRAPIGVFRSIPETRKMLIESMVEVVRVAQANKISLSDDIVKKTMSIIDNLPRNSTASMQRDIIEGRPSELMEQNGAVVHFGLLSGVNTPVNAFIYNSLLPQESQARGRVF